jgi:N-acetylglutamate synthase-like GNAT family acetyltransferase
MIEIIEFEEKYAGDFKKLNLEWLNKYNLCEEADMRVLDDPIGTMIHQDGYIFLARIGEEIVGTAGILKEHDNVYELVKMAVKNEYQGKGISKQLLECCLDKARELRVEKLILFSNHQLERALKLYQQYGFHQIPVVNSPFHTADVMMELNMMNDHQLGT